MKVSKFLHLNSVEISCESSFAFDQDIKILYHLLKSEITHSRKFSTFWISSKMKNGFFVGWISKKFSKILSKSIFFCKISEKSKKTISSKEIFHSLISFFTTWNIKYVFQALLGQTNEMILFNFKISESKFISLSIIEIFLIFSWLSKIFCLNIKNIIWRTEQDLNLWSLATHTLSKRAH